MPYLMERAKKIAVIEKARYESMLEESRKQQEEIQRHPGGTAI